MQQFFEISELQFSHSFSDSCISSLAPVLILYESIPFPVNVNRQLLKDTKDKLRLARYPSEEVLPADDWSQGTKIAELKRVAEYWRDEFDWEVEEKAIITEFNHFKVLVDVAGYGPLQLHYVHEISNGKDAIPLLFSHGWPGRFLEIRKVIKQLANPKSPSTPAFHVVAPSIPGFGFSPAPTKPGIGPTRGAQAFDKLMNLGLGYDKYVLQGGDFGSFITRSMAIQFPINPPTIRQPLTYIRYLLSSMLYSRWGKDAMAVRKNFEVDQSGYLEQQKTRPQTLGIALGDSPLGLLGWFMEKFHDWMDESNYKLNEREIVSFVMMHWIQAATPGLKFYYEAFYASHDTESTFQTYVPQPTGVSMYPKEQLHCPRDWATRVANIQYWKEHVKGGHFAPVEDPRQFLEDLRDFFGSHMVTKALVK
ncbi:alpha/beta-hydrolase [Cadophora sp. DSE1049]|nr:alpha/beta-hydrolase [Cadophora sp. DSE1049]